MVSRTRFDVSRRSDWWPAFNHSVAAPPGSVQPQQLEYTVSPTLTTDVSLLQDKLEKTLRDSITKWRPTTRWAYFVTFMLWQIVHYVCYKSHLESNVRFVTVPEVVGTEESSWQLHVVSESIYVPRRSIELGCHPKLWWLLEINTLTLWVKDFLTENHNVNRLEDAVIFLEWCR